MSLEVATWNVRDGFSREAAARTIIGVVTDLRPDFMVFPEAYREGETSFLDNIQDDFDRQGYAMAHGPYNDTDGRADRHGILAIARRDRLTTNPDLTDLDIISMGGRSAVHSTLQDPKNGEAIEAFGVHLCDRSEATRQTQLRALPLEGVPAIVVGDKNALHGTLTSARILRAAGHVVRYLPSVDPNPDKKAPPLARIGSLSQRLAGMADGGTLALLEKWGFKDADNLRQATMHSRLPVAQLDHIFTRGVEHTFGFEVGKHVDGFDHRWIKAGVVTRAAISTESSPA